MPENIMMYDGPEKECKQVLYLRLPAVLPPFATRVLNIALFFTMPSWFVTGVDVGKVCRVGGVGKQLVAFPPSPRPVVFILYVIRV